MGCDICPRNCAVTPGVCGKRDEIRVALFSLHKWEEPCISGNCGSGTVFFSGCPLRCVYCQNRKISRGMVGKAYSETELARELVELERRGAHNINFVSPTHFTPQIIRALATARTLGLSVPAVWNTSGYETEATVLSLRGTVDIFLTDFKYFDPDRAQKYSGARDYPEVAKRALARMLEVAGEPRFDENGIMTSGVIVRVLVLPEGTDDAKNIISYVHKTYGDALYLSIMNQYTPQEGLEKFPELQRKLRRAEYRQVVRHALDVGVENGFTQSGGTASESFIPDFEI